MKYKYTDIKNNRFGRLVAIERVENKILNCGRSVTQWKCRCDCGTIAIISTASLRSNSTKSCGCLVKELSRESIKKITFKHGKTNTRLFKIWCSMKDRCYNPNHVGYKNYGEKKIKICSEWMSENGFINFYNWAMKNKYDEKLSIDRIDNNGDYSPENCRWATRLEQQRNTSKTIFIEYEGKTRTIGEWAEIFDIGHELIYNRYKKGLKEDLLFIQPNKIKSNASKIGHEKRKAK